MKLKHVALAALAAASVAAACVPPGNSTHEDAGTSATANPTFRPSIDVMNAPFEDDFDRPHADAGRVALLPSPSASASASASISSPAGASAFVGPSAGPHIVMRPPPPTAAALEELGPNWRPAETNAWRIENGRLCGQRAFNHGVWLEKVLPVNARIEFDAIAESPEGDLKAEVWGDGQSHATQRTYNNATSYLTILGGWTNTYHVLARINEHAPDRRQIKVDAQADDPRAKPVYPGQIYHFKIERTDGHTVRWSVNGVDYLSWDDPQPLVGMGHDHFGFNDWEAKVCFDNVKVTPLP